MQKAGKRSLLALITLTGSTLSAQAVAEQDYDAVKEDKSFIDNLREGPVSFEIGAGVEYDSNVSVEAIDQQTAIGDYAFSFDLGAEYEKDLTDKTSVEVGYNFGQDIQAEETSFNTQTHRGSIQLSHDFGNVEGGVSYQFIYSRLGGDGFLQFNRLSPYLAAYVGDRKAYVRASYIYTDKTFFGRDGRDSDVHAGNAEVFYFLNGLNTYAIAGYRYEIENAGDAQFDFTAHNTKLRLVQRFPFNGRNAKIRGGWRFEQRNYDSITPSIGVIRDDTRHRFDASIELPINDVFSAELEYNHDIFDSNLAAADFTQDIVSFRIGGKL